MFRLPVRQSSLLLFGLVCLLAACGQATSNPGATGSLTVHCTTVSTPATTGAAGQTHPVAATKVTIQSMNGQVSQVGTTDASGSFTIALAPGSYWVLEPTLGIVGKLPQKHLVTVTKGQTATLDITINTDAGATPTT